MNHGCGPTSRGQLEKKKKLITRAMQHSEYHREDSFVCSEGSEARLEAESEGEVHGSGSDEDGACGSSLYQIEKAKKRQDCSHSEMASDVEEAGQLSDADDLATESENECEVPVKSKEDMIEHLSDLATQFARTVDKLRMSHCGQSSKPRLSLTSRDGLHVFKPMSKGSSKFFPSRKGDVIIPSTQGDDDDLEEDSTASQCSRTPRKKLLAPWRLVMIKNRQECSREEALEQFS